ncbi:MAG: sugar phosphate nucleotidyltransferase [Planctomycetota bacterium]|nr:sugar phosphate nucleotidyltransferase [Planctomycetota bacterium]
MPKPKITLGILAGGSGTRFWPAGRRSRPKQLLALDGNDPRSLLALTLERVGSITDEPPRLIAPKALAKPFRRELSKAAVDACLWEPRPRNTAAAVALIAYAGWQDAPKQPVLVVPADHHVHPVGTYRRALAAMASRARRSSSIVTLGLLPDHPATGYGYLQLGALVDERAVGRFHEVARYVEKPSAKRAKAYVKGGGFLWNGGTFAFMPEVFIHAVRTHLPEVASPMERAFERYGKRDFAKALAAAYDEMPAISVDYGVMEQAEHVETLAVKMGWDDLGSWDAIARHLEPDADGNRVRGDVTVVDSKGCVVDAIDGHVAVLGVEDIVVVRTGDTVLVTRRGQGEAVRDVVKRLETGGREDLLQ